MTHAEAVKILQKLEWIEGWDSTCPCCSYRSFNNSTPCHADDCGLKALLEWHRAKANDIGIAAMESYFQDLIKLEQTPDLEQSE